LHRGLFVCLFVISRITQTSTQSIFTKFREKVAHGHRRNHYIPVVILITLCYVMVMITVRWRHHHSAWALEECVLADSCFMITICNIGGLG